MNHVGKKTFTQRKHSKSFYARSMLVGSSALLALQACGSVTSLDSSRDLLYSSLPPSPDSWSSTVGPVGQVKVGWIEMIDDPILSKLVEEAQSKNLDLQTIAANVERSLALSEQATSNLFPVINLRLGAERNNILAGTRSDRLSASFQPSWEADIWKRIRAGQKAANFNYQSDQADYIFSQNSLAAVVARTYFLTIEAKLQVEVANETLNTLTETDRIVREQNKLGLTNVLDVALSQSDLARARLSLITAKSAQREAFRALEILLGRYPSADLTLKKSLPQVPEFPPAGTPATLLERRPDIIAAERSVAAAFNSLDQVKAARMPNIILTGDFGGPSTSLSNLSGTTNIAWQASTTLLAPLIDGGLHKARVEQASAEQKQAIASYTKTVLNAFQEVETSLDQNIVLRDQADELREVAAKSNKALHLITLRYNEGEAALLDVLTIQQRVSLAKSELVTNRRARLDEWIGLNLALGGSWRAPE